MIVRSLADEVRFALLQERSNSSRWSSVLNSSARLVLTQPQVPSNPDRVRGGVHSLIF